MISLTTVGVIAEFNPLHTGHAALLRRLRADGETCVVCVLSGNFVQRGDAALLPLSVRVEAALACGVDLCLLLPLPWAMSTAQNFADGAIGLLQDTGAVDVVAFGSECGDLAALRECAERLEDASLARLTRQHLRLGEPYAAARSHALRDLGGDAMAALLDAPNNTLGVCYLSAMRRFGFSARAVTFPRIGAPHDAATPDPLGASASHLRALVRAGKARACRDWMPPASYALLHRAVRDGAVADLNRLSTAILARLRTLSPADFAALPDLSEGLENRLYSAAQQAIDWDDLLARAKAKRYPLARIRRLFLAAYLGVDRTYFGARVPYLRVLGFSERGEALLGTIRQNTALPILTRKRDAEACGDPVRALWQLEARAADQYALALQKPQPCGTDYQYRPVKRS